MPKYIRRSRTPRTGTTSSTQDVLMRELEREGQKLLKELTRQFTRDLEKEGARVLQNLLTAPSSSGGSGANAGIASVTQLIGSLVTYAVNKPQTNTSTTESDRSRETAAQFRVSRAQAMAEATSELARSERNF